MSAPKKIVSHIEEVLNVPSDRVEKIMRDFVWSGADVKLETQSDGLHKLIATFYEDSRYLATRTLSGISPSRSAR